MMILTFEDGEEEILNHIISCVSTGARAFQVITLFHEKSTEKMLNVFLCAEKIFHFGTFSPLSLL